MRHKILLILFFFIQVIAFNGLVHSTYFDIDEFVNKMPQCDNNESLECIALKQEIYTFFDTWAACRLMAKECKNEPYLKDILDSIENDSEFYTDEEKEKAFKYVVSQGILPHYLSQKRQTNISLKNYLVKEIALVLQKNKITMN